MKKDKLQINGLQDLTVEEMAINGGFPWGALGKIAKWVAGVVAAGLLNKVLMLPFPGTEGARKIFMMQIMMVGHLIRPIAMDN